MGGREDVRTVRLTEPVTLDDLRWLVEHCNALPGEARVQLVPGVDDQRDPTPGQLVVSATPQHHVHPPKVYRGPAAGRRTGPGALPADEDRTDRRW